MTRSKLRNNYNKHLTSENWQSYKKQRNFCVKFLKKGKKEYFSNLDINQLNDNKTFWKTIKPFFSDKGINSLKLMLIENDTIVTEETDLVEIINDYFINITDKLELKQDAFLNDNGKISTVIEFYKHHLSINKICTTSKNTHFDLATVSENDVEKVIKNLPNDKANLYGDITTKILKLSLESNLPEVTKIINDCFQNGNFPNRLKLAEVLPDDM